jgi:hypothetical protein
MSDTVSADSIKAQMPHTTLTRVLGEPTHKQIKMVIRELTANLMAVSCPWGHNKGHLGLLQDPAIYMARNGAAFTIPAAEPPTYPVIPNGATAPQRKELHAINISVRKAWATYRLVLAITRDQFAAAIDNVYYAVLDDPTEGLNGVNLRTLVQYILTTYAQISQPDLDDNMTEFNIGIDSGLPLAVYTLKQEKCQIFATDAGVPISNKLMVTTGSKHALSSGNMTLNWREWKRRPAIEHTWANWKLHWTASFTEMRDISRMTTGDTTFGANQAAEIEQAQQMATSLDNLANASIEKNTTIDNLVATNAALTRSIQDIQRMLATMMTAPPTTPGTWTPAPGTPALAPPGQPTGENPPGRPSHWATVKPPWDRTGYCWSHGFKVKMGHTSGTCTSRKTGHQVSATRTNTMGGCTFNAGWPSAGLPTPPT